MFGNCKVIKMNVNEMTIMLQFQMKTTIWDKYSTRHNFLETRGVPNDFGTAP